MTPYRSRHRSTIAGQSPRPVAPHLAAPAGHDGRTVARFPVLVVQRLPDEGAHGGLRPANLAVVRDRVAEVRSEDVNRA